MTGIFQAATTALLLALLIVPASAQSRPRARDLGIPFNGTPGPLDAITDVAGVEVGLHDADLPVRGRSCVGKGPVRTGVTAILPAWSRRVPIRFSPAVSRRTATGR